MNYNDKLLDMFYKATVDMSHINSAYVDFLNASGYDPRMIGEFHDVKRLVDVAEDIYSKTHRAYSTVSMIQYSQGKGNNMNTQVDEVLKDIVNCLNQYTQGIQTYNSLTSFSSTEWVDQRTAYDAWVNANNSYINYLSTINILTQVLTQDLVVPVPALSTIGIGILGLGIIYINTGTAAHLLSAGMHPFYESTIPEHNQTGYIMAVGGLPNGTVIYTSIATYLIQDGKVTELTV